jgi:hypothetical protein
MKPFALRQLLAATAWAEGSLTPSEGHAEPGQNPRMTLLLRNETRARRPRYRKHTCSRSRCTFIPASRCKISQALTCGCFTQSHTWRELVELYQLTQPARNLRPRYNIVPTTAIDAVKW